MVPKIIVSSSLDIRQKEIEKILADLKLKNPSPDLLYLPSDSKLGIEQARKLKEHLNFKPIQAKGKVIVLEEASNLTDDAQNALLKILEEPPENALIILGVRNEQDLLPTVLSRCEVVRIMNNEPRILNDRYHADIQKLIRSTTSERFEYIDKVKDKQEFLKALMRYFHQEFPDNPDLREYLDELLQAEEWAKHNINIRAILEYLMLRLPEVQMKKGISRPANGNTDSPIH